MGANYELGNNKDTIVHFGNATTPVSTRTTTGTINPIAPSTVTAGASTITSEPVYGGNLSTGANDALNNLSNKNYGTRGLVDGYAKDYTYKPSDPYAYFLDQTKDIRSSFKSGNGTSNIGKSISSKGWTNSGSSGSGSGSSSSSADGVNGAYAAYMQLAAAQMAAQQARADQAAAAQRAAAENAYNRGISALETAYGNKMNMLNNNYNSTLDQLKNALTYSQGNVNSDADASLKQAYINNMMNQKNLNQQLTAQGLSGGASESTLARLLTNYGNSRNNIENTRNSNLNELYNTYNNNLSSANQAYNNALANADAERMQYLMNLENALANNQIATEQNYQNALTANNDTYLSALANAVDMMNAYNYSPSAATNDVNLATVLQNAVNGGVYNRNANTGAVEQAATTELEKANNNAYINALLKSMYGES